jgi:hypothetical protein
VSFTNPKSEVWTKIAQKGLLLGLANILERG